MRGTPRPQFNPELRRFLQATLQSPESQQVLRYKPFVKEGHIFPYEGTLASHSTGTYRRGARLLRLEAQLRAEQGLPPLGINRTFQGMLHKSHDLGELGEQEDLLHGTKTDAHRAVESQQFQANLEQTNDPDIRATLEMVKVATENHQATQAGRFWKNAVEHGGFLETARRLHRRFVAGEKLDETQVNQESNMYLQHSVLADQSGSPVQPRLVGVRAIITDLLTNSAQPVLKGAEEFLVIRQYLAQHGKELRTLYEHYLMDVEQNTATFQEILSFKEYTPAAAAAQHMSRRKNALNMLSDLDDVAPSLPAQRPPAKLVELRDGKESEVA